MKRLVIVSPAFAPSQSPAAHRARLLARYGASFGYAVEIATVDPAYYEEKLDYDLLPLVPGQTKVTRSPAWPARLTRRIGIGDLGIRSYFPMRRTLRRLCAQRRPDALLITSPPWHTFMLGPDLLRRFGVPFVLDYTDPWVYPLRDADNRPWRKAFWFRRLATVLEPRAVREASHLLAVSDATHSGLRTRHPEIPSARFSAVPFGFESSDFDYLKQNPRPHGFWTAGDGNVHVVYVGVMFDDAVETVRALFAAVKLLRSTDTVLAKRLRLHFIGTSYAPHQSEPVVIPLAQSEGVADQVTEHVNRIPYLDALNVLCTADVVVSIGGTARHYTSSKIFPCLLANKPLLAVYHEESTVCEIVRGAEGTELVTYNDRARAQDHVAKIATSLSRLVTEDARAEAALRRNLDGRYSAEACAGHIYRVIDNIVETSGGRAHTTPPKH
ncbi:MAG: hypothetical protein NVSMB53_18260 [Gemmatimonadaceae bacterium]